MKSHNNSAKILKQLIIINDELTNVASILEILKETREYYTAADYQILLDMSLRKQYKILKCINDIYEHFS